MTSIYLEESDEITVGFSASGEGSPLGIYSSIERVMTVWPDKYQVSDSMGGHQIYVESNGSEFGISVEYPNGESLLWFSVDSEGRVILKLPSETIEEEPLDWGDKLVQALKETDQAYYFTALQKGYGGMYRIETVNGCTFDHRFWKVFGRFPFRINDVVRMSSGMALTWSVSADADAEAS